VHRGDPVLYIYALLDGDHPADSQIPGHDDLPVLFVQAGGFTAAVTEHTNGTPRAGSRALRRHERVVEALMSDGPLLPQRFGTVATDAASLDRNVDYRREALAEALDLVRGRVEVAVRVVPRARRWDNRDLAASVHAPLAELAYESRLSAHPASPAALAAAYLLENGDGYAGFVACAAAIASRRPELAISCTGPWPPYSFSDG
jgi:hypothetical protein